MNTTKTPFGIRRPLVDYPSFEGKSATLYVLECAGYYKIGITRNFASRFKSISHGCPLPVSKVATRTVPAAGLMQAEAWLHQKLVDRCVKGEWFAVEREEIRPLLQKAVAKAKQYDRECADVYAEWSEANRLKHLREALAYFDKNSPEEASRIREDCAEEVRELEAAL